MDTTDKDAPTPGVKAALMVGVLYAEEKHYLRARERLVEKFGPLMLETVPRRWDYTGYYAAELGPEIKRRFLFFENLILQYGLAEIKLFTDRMEEEFSIGGRRTVNLDPGYMTAAKLVLASMKDYSHRICIGNGVFAEVTLAYVKKEGFKPFYYTYRDYRDEFYLRLLDEVREVVKERLG